VVSTGSFVVIPAEHVPPDIRAAWESNRQHLRPAEKSSRKCANSSYSGADDVQGPVTKVLSANGREWTRIILQKRNPLGSSPHWRRWAFIRVHWRSFAVESFLVALVSRWNSCASLTKSGHAKPSQHDPAELVLLSVKSVKSIVKSLPHVRQPRRA
jgi:hypothetical protein